MGLLQDIRKGTTELKKDKPIREEDCVSVNIKLTCDRLEDGRCTDESIRPPCYGKCCLTCDDMATKACEERCRDLETMFSFAPFFTLLEWNQIDDEA